jgi:hypothetical protein
MAMRSTLSQFFRSSEKPRLPFSYTAFRGFNPAYKYQKVNQGRVFVGVLLLISTALVTFNIAGKFEIIE